MTAPASVGLGVQSIDLARLKADGFLVPGEAPGQIGEEFRLVKRRLLRTVDDLTAEAQDAAMPGSARRLPSGAFPGRERMVLICSSRPSEGKTFCSINLALSLARERDTRVLLVDADFAKPSVLGILGLESELGLMDALAQPERDVEDLVIATDVPGLSVLGAGRQTMHDTEMLSSARGRAVLQRLAQADPSRILIFDSAPALAASPAAVLALVVGQIIMIVRADRTTEGEVREAVALVDACPHISLLLNGTSFAGEVRKFGAYYGHARSD